MTYEVKSITKVTQEKLALVVSFNGKKDENYEVDLTHVGEDAQAYVDTVLTEAANSVKPAKEAPVVSLSLGKISITMPLKDEVVPK